MFFQVLLNRNGQNYSIYVYFFITELNFWASVYLKPHLAKPPTESQTQIETYSQAKVPALNLRSSQAQT